MAKSFRKTKLENRILQLSNQFIRTESSETSLKLVSFTKIELTSDFSEAKIFWDTFNTDQKSNVELAMKSLERPLRSYLARELQIKHVPVLELLYDGEFESAKVIEDILDKEKNEGRDF